MDIVNDIRDSLPHRYLKNPNNIGDYIGEFAVPALNEMIKSDPSEAADSENILNSVTKYFPNADITCTGGIVYCLALSGIYSNFNEENETDVNILHQLLEKDKTLCQDQGIDSLYAVALAENL